MSSNDNQNDDGGVMDIDDSSSVSSNNSNAGGINNGGGGDAPINNADRAVRSNNGGSPIGDNQLPPTPSTTASSRASRRQLSSTSQRRLAMADNDSDDNSDAPMTPDSTSVPGSFAGSFGASLVSSTRRNLLNNSPTNASISIRRQDQDGNEDLINDNESQNDNGRVHHIEEEEEEETEQTLIRGTDIHVHTAAKAFKDFLQNFISLEESERVLKRNRRHLRRRRQRQAENDNDGNSLEEDSLSDSDSDLESITNTPKKLLYMEQLRNILLGRHRLKDQTDDNDASLTSSNAVETSASLDINTLHLYYHSPQCQRLYHQLVSYPAEVVPLMDLIVSKEMEAVLRELHDEAAAVMNDDNSQQEGGDEVRNEAYYATLHPIDIPLPRVQVRPYHLKSLSQMRALDPNSIDNLLSIRGMVVRTSPIIPDLKVAHFSCSICKSSVNVTLERGRIAEPTVCSSCNTRKSFELIHNRSLFADKQMVRIQETPNEVPAGETPASIVLFAYDDLVDAVRPGDRVEVTGVFRAQARRVNPKISKVKSVYRTYLDVIHFRRVDGNKQYDNSDFGAANEEEGEKALGDEEMTGQGKGIATRNENGKLSQERIDQLKELSQDPQIYEKLVQSIAPSIWELDNVKKGVLCMLFGGNSKRIKKGTAEKKKRREERGGSDFYSDTDSDDEMDTSDNDGEEGAADKLHKRGDINILLCGDPGTSKSQLLSYVHKLSPRGVYTSGKGSSAVGLTASIVRDPETRELVLESGALVLSDLGICCIDEFDKMSDTTRAILHEAMEQQTVSIAKAGIIATLNARTSILASANPVESRYNPQISVVDNIKLPPTLLSRFDLIYLILDAPNVENDRRLAQHLVGLYYDTPDVVQPPLDHDLLRDYISYARDNIHPELSDLATRELINAYLEMRRMGLRGGNNGTRTISATPRQLESLVRLSEGLAKMRYSLVVTRADVREAVRLMKVATQAAATDPRTGRIDMDMITTGRSTANREMEEALNLSLKELLAERRGNRMALSDVRKQLSEIMNVSTVQQTDIAEALRLMEADGLIQFNERSQTIFVRAGVAN